MGQSGRLATKPWKRKIFAKIQFYKSDRSLIELRRLARPRGLEQPRSRFLDRAKSMHAKVPGQWKGFTPQPLSGLHRSPHQSGKDSLGTGPQQTTATGVHLPRPATMWSPCKEKREAPGPVVPPPANRKCKGCISVQHRYASRDCQRTPGRHPPWRLLFDALRAGNRHRESQLRQ